MIYPAAMFIEMAIDGLKLLDRKDIDHQLKEFHVAGQIRDCDLEGLSDAEKGYLIGMQTARVLLETMPLAVIAKVSL